ncbi:PHD finger protein 10-like [Trichogramma pretiosum]|uniref:PHD finger protein 10-like n=1 Tax=Trichogramma pretiosum TaxID=7493 RepID=UPI000C719B9A|nr:PHD finger protein 10-like [Trichogramma pretiosum]
MGKDWIPNGEIHESNNNITDINSTKSFENHSSQDITNCTVKKSNKAERKQKLEIRHDLDYDSQDMFDVSSDNKIEPYKEIKDVLKEKFLASLNLIRTSLIPSDTNNTGSVRAPRRLTRIRKVKKVFDPSDNFIVKKKRSKQPKTMPTKPKKPKTMPTKPNATIPQENRETVTHSQNKETSKDKYFHCCSSDKPDSLVACKDCTTKVHLSCALPSKKTSKKALIDWRCERCKMCEVCHDTVESGTMVSCYQCDRASHIKCLSDKKTQKASKWECQDCQTKRKSPSLEKVSKSSDSTDASEVTNPLKAEIKETANSPKISEVIHYKRDPKIHRFEILFWNQIPANNGVCLY